ncbi:hypothetical protein BDY21DRAFT_386889 [Lineolata rhizophorae]|uniref:CipC-like antibiotic response protein n=1 Tax=Lineolata rhizophorae TaxID=578093 RepID=A0A6A6NUX8_9PEZI|nr:hypothetical protein BDY21DRAFT_386889 [Lineolata rhizophorae]
MARRDSHEAYKEVAGSDNQANFGHELIAGGAAFAGFKAFEDHQRRKGKPVAHALAKELLAGFAAAEVDKLAETKGADHVDREKAKHHATRDAERMYDEHYLEGQRAGEYDPRRYGAPRRINEEYGTRNYGEGGGGC